MVCGHAAKKFPAIRYYPKLQVTPPPVLNPKNTLLLCLILSALHDRFFLASHHHDLVKMLDAA